MAESNGGTTAEKGGWLDSWWARGGLILLIALLLWFFVSEITSLDKKTENHEGRITVLEKNDSQYAGKIKVLQGADAKITEDQSAKIDTAIKEHEKRLHSKKPPAKHHASAGKQKEAPVKNIDTATVLANVIKSCADRGGELVSESGKVTCVTKITQQPAQAEQPKVAQLETSKVGTPCPGDGRSATYRIINGQLACLLDGVRVNEGPVYRREPEVVYAEPRRVIREELPSSQEEGAYYEEDQGSSGLSWVPWGIAAGALLWGATRKTTPAPATVATVRPAVTTNPVGLGVVTGPAW